MALLTQLFPLLALMMALLAWLIPDLFMPLGGAIVPLLTLIMFAMGLTLTLDNVRELGNKLSGLVLGTALQFLLMPALAFGLARLLGLGPELTTGLILVGCCPGGTASNVVCFLAKGNVALSISLTLLSTLLSVFATPLLTWLYLGQSIEVPIADMMLSIVQVVLVPVLVVVLHNLLGYASAYSACKWLKHDEATCRTIAIEVGMQNSGLAVALATQFYTAAAALPGAVFSLWHNLSGAMLAGYWSRNRERS